MNVGRAHLSLIDIVVDTPGHNTGPTFISGPGNEQLPHKESDSRPFSGTLIT